MNLQVLHVLNHFLPYQTAGTEVYVDSLIRSLRALGVHGQVAIPHYNQSVDANYAYQGVNVYQFAQVESPSREVVLGLRAPSGVQSFERLLQQLKPDIIHFHELAGSTGVGVFHVQRAKRLGFKTIMTFHLASSTCQTGTMMYKRNALCDGRIELRRCASCTLEYRGKLNWAPWLIPMSTTCNALGISALHWNSKLGTALGIVQQIDQLRQRFKLLVEHLDQLVSLTHWYQDVLLRNKVPAAKISLIPQAIALPTASIMSQQTRSPFMGDRPLRLLFLGRISPFKGLHTLIDAVLELPASSVELMIYGQTNDATYEAELQDRTAHAPQIRWMGTVSRERVMEVFQTVDVLCLCSTFSEMSPLVIQEAFAAGVPVIASEVPGNLEQIKHGVNGWTFPIADSLSLRSIIQSVIDKPSQWQNIQSNIQKPAQFDQVAQGYQEVYQRMSRSTIVGL